MAPDDETFNLAELSLDGSRSRQLTHTTGGATAPDVAPDGKTIVFVGYTTTGADLFSMPYPDNVVQAFRPAVAAVESSVEATAPTTEPPARPITGYSPLPTLKPTSWMPVVETGNQQIRVGAGISGFDLLGYHAYAATATWLVSSPAGSPGTNAATPDWQLYYLYNRWRPALYAAATSDTSFFDGPATDGGTAAPATRRERLLEGGVVVPFRHTRIQHAGRVSIARSAVDYSLATGALSRDRTPIRAAWQTLSAHEYEYSISRERGVAAGATVEAVRRSLGSSADATTATADVRAYLPGLALHHVVAVRLGGGRSSGDATVGRTFLLGGDSPGAGVNDLGSGAFTLLRGFSPNTFPGSRIAIANAEYRWPIARPQRGHGTWPLFLHTVHAAVFADAGHAWTQTFRSSAIKTSAGAQLSAHLVAGYFAPLTVSAGAAWGHDGSGTLADRVTGYFRVGKAF